MAKPVADMLRSSVAVTVFHTLSAHHLNFSIVKDVAGADNLRACSRGAKTFASWLDRRDHATDLLDDLATFDDQKLICGGDLSTIP